MNLKTNPELLPLIEWWEKEGKKFVTCLAIAILAFGGCRYYRYSTAAKKTAASDAVISAYTTEEMERAVSSFGSQDAGGVLKLRLAKSYFDAGSYDAALAQYEELLSAPPEGFQDIATVGRAYCLEALQKFDEAQQAFDAFANADTNGYLRLTAQLSAARCLLEKGEDKAAFARLEDLRKAYEGKDAAKARIDAMEGVMKRFRK